MSAWECAEAYVWGDRLWYTLGAFGSAALCWWVLCSEAVAARADGEVSEEHPG